MIPAPLLFIFLPLLITPLLYALRLRRWLWAEAATAAGVAGLLAALASVMPLGASPWFSDSFSVLGRLFIMEPADRGLLTLIFLLAALIFLSAGLQIQARYFISAGMAALGLLAAAVFVRPFLFAAIFIELVAALMVFLLADERHPAPRGALRLLIYTSLGMPFILFTGWLLDVNATNPADTGVLVQATLCLGAGLALLLGVVPFHSWLPLIAEEAPPLATLYASTVARAPVILLMLKLLNTYSWLNSNPGVYAALELAGLVMVVIGALFVFGQRNLGRSVGYALLIEAGAVLLAVSLGMPAGAEVALASLSQRGLSLWLWAMATDQLRRATLFGRDQFDVVRGLGWRYPFAVTAVAIGVFSLVGLPLMAGFPPRWALLQLLAERNLALALGLLLAMTSVGVVVMRGLAALTTPRSADEVIVPNETLWQRAAYGVGVLLVLALGAFPQWVLPAVTATAAAFNW